MNDESNRGPTEEPLDPRGVTQTILHDPELGTIGNCMQAAVATLLGLPLGDVPHFAAIEGDWGAAFKAWCLGRQLLWISLGVMDVPDDMPCILCGKSPRGIEHCTVGRGLDTVWDPHPSRDGLTTISEVWVLAPYLPEVRP